MGTMNMGYHYDMAKSNGNHYSLIIDGREVITNGTYLSVLQNFKSEVNYHRGRFLKAHIIMVKTYDGRKKEETDEIVREFDNRREF
ncbi:hypothetical protein [Dethiothermospora halolimnae]|uniref:hypothetical protein n=1 Tax=Dethiothermospora halolimnae TaxID=3114390 RepID=UPI003CCBEC1C